MGLRATFQTFVFVIVLVGTAKQACLSPCNSCDGSTCKMCPKGFRADGDACIPCTQLGCLECSATACTMCNSGTYYDTTAKKCMFCPANCGKCSAENVCNACFTGFIQDSTGKCIPGVGPTSGTTFAVSSEPKSSSSSGLLIGLLVGGGVILIIAGILVWWYIKNRSKPKSQVAPASGMVRAGSAIIPPGKSDQESSMIGLNGKDDHLKGTGMGGTEKN